MATSTSPLRGVLVGGVLALAVGLGAFAVWRMDPSGERGSGLPTSCDYDLDAYEKIDPAMVRYRQTAEIPVAMDEVRAVAVGADDRILVAGDRSIVVLAADGKKLSEIPLDEEPYCVAVAPANRNRLPGRVLVGLKDHVEVFEAGGHRQAKWDQLSKRSWLTSIAVADDGIFLADAGSLVVWRCDPDGRVLGQIGKPDPSRDIEGFAVPSPYFDVALAPDGLLRIANTGMLRVEGYTFDGHKELAWGKSGTAVANFCGCCGPSNIAILPDGRVVTAEKGIPRVKIYTASGELDCIVAGPETLAPNLNELIKTCDEHARQPVDLAVDSRGRILVLDPTARSVRVFETIGGASP